MAVGFHGRLWESISMPVHDWTRVDAGIFHAFHHDWITEISRALNRGLLPANFYALPEQIAGGLGKAVTIRHVSDHQVVAMVEIVSPGNKNNQNGLNAFVRKAREALAAGIHLLLIDLFPPSPRDPQGIHQAVWGEDCSADYALPPDKPLTCVSYIGGAGAEAFIELVAVGELLPDMPLFLTPELYVLVPLEATYQSAWDAMPAYWRDVLTAEPKPPSEP
jgi:hypothetical protein